jgi:hypothetical protein
MNVVQSIAPAKDGHDMAEWLAMEQWPQGARMARPGFVFEVENAAGQRLLTGWEPVVATPFGWSAAPLRFRLVPEAPAERSAPLPAPRA